MDEIDAMFSDLLGEMDLLTQSLTSETASPEGPSQLDHEMSYSIGFKDLNESLNALEDKDLDSLMADLDCDLGGKEEKLSVDQNQDLQAPPCEDSTAVVQSKCLGSVVEPTQQSCKPLEALESKDKSDKIKIALEKLKEAKVKKLVVKVTMDDGSSKTLMVDERQTVREVLDSLFEKTHCDGNVDWCLWETSPGLQLERGFEDHEFLVEALSGWMRDSENKILFLERSDKYALFKNPQNFYLWKKEKAVLKQTKEKEKENIIQENFCGASIIVPDLEGPLFLKEDGKKSWKRRLFLLRASGIYYVPKGKTKTSSDLACFIQFDNVNIYYGSDDKNKYKAPTEFCFVLKHPQIQKESQYIKYLCCDSQWALTLWVTSIRVAKYGATLYNNYTAAKQRASASQSCWSSRTSPSTTPQIPKVNGCPAPASLSNTASPTPLGKVEVQAGAHFQPPLPVEDYLPPPPPDPRLFPPPPCFITVTPEEFPPPPNTDDLDLPPDFIPPPPPAQRRSPSPSKKVAPPPPRRTTPISSVTGGAEESDMMSELMKVMERTHK